MKRLNESDLIGTQINDWKVLEYVGDHKLKCECSCGKLKIVSKYDLLNNTSTNCGHSRRKTDLTGQQIGDWKVIRYKGNNRYTCQCKCGVIKDILTQTLKSNPSMQCSHINPQDIVGTKINEWTVIEYLGDYKYKCRCSCGEIKSITRYALIDETSKSCGHDTNKFIDLTGKQFGELTVKKYLGNGEWLCKCSCGKMTKVTGRLLRRNGNSASCGHTTLEILQSMSKQSRTQEQKEAVLSKENLEKFIRKQDKRELDFKELSSLLGLVYPSTVRLVNKYNLGHLISKKSNTSYLEDEVYKYIKSLVPNENIQRNQRRKLGEHTRELDIYLPDKKLAIEFNGTYWHSSEHISKNYHKQKTIACATQGIRLIHIFEYEWINKEVRPKIENLLSDMLVSNREAIYARETTVEEISDSEASEFCELYHLQGYAKSSIRLGIKQNGILLGVMTFGIPRFNNEYQYEIIRLCYKQGILVIGGTDKLYKYFLRKYNPDSVLTYADISKFMGNTYLKLGFRVDSFTEPNYKWVKPNTLEVLSRYQTQKQKLLEAHLGDKNQTESEIMESLGFLKVYDSGNLKLTWNK